MDSIEHRVVSYGGGVNSTAMLIELVRRKETVDLILFADTGGELDETYEYISTFSDWLAAHGMPPIVTVRSPRETLEESVLKLHTIPAVAFNSKKTCSMRFKVEPQQKFVRKWRKTLPDVSRDEPIVWLIGIDAGEASRAKYNENDSYIERYPLIEWKWDRKRCTAEILAEGLPLPPKSSCFYCPNMKKQEVVQLIIDHPDRFERAVAMERNARPRLTKRVRGLGRAWKWEDIGEKFRRQIPIEFDDELEPRRACVCHELPTT